MKRIGIFSGTFDPIHIGHIESCLVARAATDLDEVVVLIEKHPQRKQSVTDYDHRKSMVQLALSEYDSVNLFETNQENITFTRTLKNLEEEFPGSQFVMIVGSDMVKYLLEWPGAEESLRSIELCIVKRRNQEDLSSYMQNLVQKIPDIKIHVLPAVWSPVSSSSIRENLGKAAEQGLVKRQVAEYAKTNNLY